MASRTGPAFPRFGKTLTYSDDLERDLEFDIDARHSQWNAVKWV